MLRTDTLGPRRVEGRDQRPEPLALATPADDELTERTAANGGWMDG